MIQTSSRSSVHRPYSKIRGSEPSVTTILGAVHSPPALRWGAAKESALFAVHHVDEWQALHPDAATDRIRRHHDGVWKARAAMGTLVHAANEAFCEGEDFDIAKAVSDLISDEPGASIWKTMNFDDVVNQALGYVLGLEAWWTDFHPVVDTYESVVRYPGKYIGSLDLRCVVNELDTIVDIKTTSVQDEDKGLYTDSWSLQLAGYGYAPEEVLYEDHVCQAPDPSTWTPKGWWECSTCGKRQKEEGDKRPRVREVGTRPWSPPEAYGVIHLRGQEDYGFYKMPVDESVHKHFLALADLYAWQSKLATPSLIAAA